MWLTAIGSLYGNKAFGWVRALMELLGPRTAMMWLTAIGSLYGNKAFGWVKALMELLGPRTAMLWLTGIGSLCGNKAFGWVRALMELLGPRESHNVANSHRFPICKQGFWMGKGSYGASWPQGEP